MQVFAQSTGNSQFWRGAGVYLRFELLASGQWWVGLAGSFVGGCVSVLVRLSKQVYNFYGLYTLPPPRPHVYTGRKSCKPEFS